METWVLAAGCPIRHRPFTSTEWKKINCGLTLGSSWWWVCTKQVWQQRLRCSSIRKRLPTTRWRSAKTPWQQVTAARQQSTVWGHLSQRNWVIPASVKPLWWHQSMLVDSPWRISCSCIDFEARSWHILTPSLFVLVHLRRCCHV